MAKLKENLKKELKKRYKLKDDFLNIAVDDYLINDYTAKRFLIRQEYLRRKKDIHRKGCEADGNVLCKKIVEDLMKKYDVCEQTVWNYLRY